MRVLLFNGSLDRREGATSEKISKYFEERFLAKGLSVDVFRVTDSGVPLFDATLNKVPNAVDRMNIMFREATLQVWLTPLYHGGMTGVMKNCLDWLECSAKMPSPYLTGKLIGLVCWADGVQAMQGINGMDDVAKALRGWTLPYSLPMQRKQLLTVEGELTLEYKERIDKMVRLLLCSPFYKKS